MTDASTNPNSTTNTGAAPTEPTIPSPSAPAATGGRAAPAAEAAYADPLPRKRRPLVATILWGAMMLAIAAFFAARELAPGGLDLVTWLLTAVVGIGLLLVVAGIAAASRRAG
ncbi:hypothetical protein [Cryobacterium sp.]|jgi:hypothetical protein|uniref:hypothetical protein n=1 Tax=Cryobacterium sp. TaxID=1926290 RepID=UPI0026233ECF|nr:hypothetical protein [Cryobacterium sp.]MCU1444400.1 hypothetical protein [Cryobacterium sp.]